jgi:acyl-CoA synthetase (AMP-forming)/AMP-acid ligase II
VFSCGAPVPAEVIRRTLDCVAAGAKMHTPYGATECLPVSTIEATEVLGETSVPTNKGAGICVGRKFDSIEWRVIRISDEPISTMKDAEELPAGEIGELIARGPQASPMYVTRTEANVHAKISDDPADALNETTWHRIGDVGYFDDAGRFWYCGRKSHRVETDEGTLFTECVEAVFNTHPDITRTALVGLDSAGCQVPMIFYELRATRRRGEIELIEELKQLGNRFQVTRAIQYFVEFPGIPVDVRHNAKILREQLTEYARSIDLAYLLGIKTQS